MGPKSADRHRRLALTVFRLMDHLFSASSLHRSVHLLASAMVQDFSETRVTSKTSTVSPDLRTLGLPRPGHASILSKFQDIQSRTVAVRLEPSSGPGATRDRLDSQTTTSPSRSPPSSVFNNSRWVSSRARLMPSTLESTLREQTHDSRTRGERPVRRSATTLEAHFGSFQSLHDDGHRLCVFSRLFVPRSTSA